jgi:seryl-tRNA synthetase
MKLYELTTQYSQVMDMLNNTDADMQAIKDTLEGLQGDIEDKAINIAKMIKSLDADIAAIKAEEERLSERRKVYENRRESIKEHLEQQLSAVGVEKVKTATMTVSMQNNAPSIKVISEDRFYETIPKMYRIAQPYKVDKKAVLEAMKNGEMFVGAELQQTKSLRIR